MNTSSASASSETLAKIAADDRNIFGTLNLPGISAGLRERVRTSLGGEEPLHNRAWKLIRQGEISQARALLEQALPRDEVDSSDDRYFGIYWGLGECAVLENRRTEALDYYCEAISRFPRALRKNHLARLEELGVRFAEDILRDRHDGLRETDATAIAMRVLTCIRESNGFQHDGNKAESFIASTEGAVNPHVTRSNVRTYL